MKLATLPPVIELRDAPPRPQIRNAAIPVWSELHRVRIQQSSWKSVAFSRITALEQGKNIAGAGDFRPSERAAGQLRLYVDHIALESLPMPSIIPLSGRGIMLTWQSGIRAVEVTSFADGEIVAEARENNETICDLPMSDPDSILLWMVMSPETKRPYVKAR